MNDALNKRSRVPQARLWKVSFRTEILLAAELIRLGESRSKTRRPSLVPTLNESVSFFRKRGCNGDDLESRQE